MEILCLALFITAGLLGMLLIRWLVPNVTTAEERAWL